MENHLCYYEKSISLLQKMHILKKGKEWGIGIKD